MQPITVRSSRILCNPLAKTSRQDEEVQQPADTEASEVDMVFFVTQSFGGRKRKKTNLSSLYSNTVILENYRVRDYSSCTLVLKWSVAWVEGACKSLQSDVSDGTASTEGLVSSLDIISNQVFMSVYNYNTCSRFSRPIEAVVRKSSKAMSL